MHFTGTVCLFIAAIAPATLASTIVDPPTYPPPTLPPTLTPLFTITTQAADVQKPIPRLLGGYQSIYPIIGGNITGPALNGTIYHGAATPHITDDGAFAFSIRQYYGNTTDGENFLIQQHGVGEYTKEQTWLAITIGGDYAYLRHVFLLTQNDVDIATGIAKVTVYGVNLQDQLSSLP